MSITFASEAKVLIRPFAKLLVTFQKRQYLFAAQCIWWIAALDQVGPVWRYVINNPKLPSEILVARKVLESNTIQREISTTPRDIQRRSPSEEPVPPSQYTADPLRHTRNGRIDPLPQSQRQLKAEQKRLLRIKIRKYGIE